MSNDVYPKDYPNWRTNAFDRAEDAAYAFGYHLIVHCRDEAIATIPQDASQDTRKITEEAVDVALHNVMDMLEGFWKLETGPEHSIELALGVRVHDADNNVLETNEISPCKQDLPIGYWKWAHYREFR